MVEIPATEFARPGWGGTTAQGDNPAVTDYDNTMSVVTGFRFIIATNVASGVDVNNASMDIDKIEVH